MRRAPAGLLACLDLAAAPAALSEPEPPLGLDPRPAWLVSRMQDGPLEEQLDACLGQPIRRTLFSIGHRGAPLMFPEHTAESNIAAAAQGAGILECDVTFTKELERVRRQAQNDLHTTTNILATPLAATCIKPFTPAAGETPASAECRTSEITLAGFLTLEPKMDDRNPKAATVGDSMRSTNSWRTDLYRHGTTLLTHARSIELFRSLGARFTPELKAPAVEMPFEGFTRQDYAQKLVDEDKAAGVPPEDVFLQSFQLEDMLYWIEAEPAFGARAVHLDSSCEEIEGWSPLDPATWKPSMAELKGMGVNIVAPPLRVLVTLKDGRIVPSPYARAAKDAGLDIITWTLERSGPLHTGGGWYVQSIRDVTDHDGIHYELLHVLAQDLGVRGVFSDWPVTVSFYASCMDLD